MVKTVSDAVEALLPNASKYSIYGNTIDLWEDEVYSQPTKEELTQKIAELEYLEEVNNYKEKRAAEYPSWEAQLDYIYHNGVDAWKTDIVDPVKTKYSKQIVNNDELNARKAQALFNYQLEEYIAAAARLAQYILANGRDEVREMQSSNTQLTDSDGALQFDSDGAAIYEQVEVITVTAIDPVAATITETMLDSDGDPTQIEVINPLITKDNEERTAAQATIDATPQPVIDEYNS